LFSTTSPVILLVYAGLSLGLAFGSTHIIFFSSTSSACAIVSSTSILSHAGNDISCSSAFLIHRMSHQDLTNVIHLLVNTGSRANLIRSNLFSFGLNSNIGYCTHLSFIASYRSLRNFIWSLFIVTVSHDINMFENHIILRWSAIINALSIVTDGAEVSAYQSNRNVPLVILCFHHTMIDASSDVALVLNAGSINIPIMMSSFLYACVHSKSW